MIKPADVGTKKLISLAPDNWVRWVTQIPDIVAIEILNSEFQWISRESDVLIRVKNPQGEEFLVLNEVQLRYDPRIPRRIRAYAGLAEEKFNLPIYPVLVNILKTTNVEIPTTYRANSGGLQVRQDYRVINLWEVDARIAFQESLPSLLPFVPILKDGENESTIREALQILRSNEQLKQLETVLAFFATFVLETELVQEIMRWDMAVLRESPWYQEILREGQARGEARGEARGKREGIILSIENSLEAKFGKDGLELMAQIAPISDLEYLQLVLRQIITANTVAELRQMLSSES